MPTTSNFGWTTPADTDLVKNGALAIRTLGNGIDTTMAELKGGTTGQVLSKTSNTDMDFTWINNDQGDITEVQAGTGISVASGTGPIPVVTNTVATAFDAKGDLVAGTGADTFSKLTVGANNTVLTADSTTATGLKWATPATPTFAGASAYRTTNLTTSNITYTLVTFDAENFDTDAYHSTTTNTSRMTIPSGKAGKYLVSGNVAWANNATGLRVVDLMKNASNVTYFQVQPLSGDNTVATMSCVIDCAVGDYIEIRAYQNSGGNLVVAGGTSTIFQVSYLGA